MGRIRTKVLVIGGGPAGSQAARTLAQKGTDVVLLERDLSFQKPCGGGIPSSAFGELNLPADTVHHEVGEIKIVSPQSRSLVIRLAGVNLAVVERREFDAALRNKAAEHGARLVEADFRCFADRGSTVVSEAIMRGEKVLIESDYVIAADGVNSRTRTTLGLPPVPSVFTVTGKVLGEHADACEFWFGSSHAPRVYSWVFPLKQGVTVGTGSLNPKMAVRMWHRFLARRAEETGRECLPGSLTPRGYRIPLWQGDLFGHGRILFVGDAAGQVMPLSFEGIYYAMKSGEIAAHALSEGRLNDYRDIWRKRFHKRFLLMRRLWEYFLKNDRRAERLFDIHRRPEVQEASMRLWLRKDAGKGSLLSYLQFFRRLISPGLL